MQLSYENQGSNSFLVCKLQDDEKLDSFNFGMLSNNKMDYILPVLYSVENDEHFLRYNITGKISLSEYFLGFVQKKRVVNVFYSIVNAMLEAEAYMIDEGMFLLDNDNVFVDVNSCKAYLICLPVLDYKKNKSVYDFLKNILFSLKYDQSENTNYVTDIFNFLNTNNNASLEDFKKLLFDLMKKTNADKSYEFVKNDKPNQYVKKESTVSNTGKNSEVHEYKPNKSKLSLNKETNTAPNGAFAIPKNNEANCKSKVENSVAVVPEKKISFMHLMMNFSKENLEIYKSQKINNVNDGASNSKASSKKRQVNMSDNFQFNIPGKEAPFTKNTLPNVNINQSNTYEQASPKNINDKKTSGNITNKKSIAEKLDNKKIDFGATVYWDEDKLNSTVLINDNAVNGNNSILSNPRLIRCKTRQSVEIETNPFRIGKEKDFVDYYIDANPAISGCHAFIYNDDNRFFIKDMNSTNHVYINGRMIQPNVMVPINNNDVIRLADEDFDFILF